MIELSYFLTQYNKELPKLYREPLLSRLHPPCPLQYPLKWYSNWYRILRLFIQKKNTVAVVGIGTTILNYGSLVLVRYCQLEIVYCHFNSKFSIPTLNIATVTKKLCTWEKKNVIFIITKVLRFQQILLSLRKKLIRLSIAVETKRGIIFFHFSNFMLNNDVIFKYIEDSTFLADIFWFAFVKKKREKLSNIN